MSKLNADLVHFDELKANVTVMVAPALTLTVSSFADAEIAVETGKTVKSYLKAIEAKRKELTAPFKERAKVIETYAHTLEEPLLQVEAHIKKICGAFQLEQNKIREEALRKAQAEQQERERVAQVERARVAAIAEAARQEQMAQARFEAERAAEAAAMFGCETVDPAEAVKLAEVEHELARAREQAEAEREAAVRVAQAKEENWRINDQRIKNTSPVWLHRVVDASLVPRDLCEPHDQAIKKRLNATNGLAIPGVDAWPEVSMRLGAKTSVSRAAIESGA